MAFRIACECGETELRWFSGTGRLAGYDYLGCAKCGEPVDDDGTTATRVWVGH